jgi:hypothetical protein
LLISGKHSIMPWTRKEERRESLFTKNGVVACNQQGLQHEIAGTGPVTGAPGPAERPFGEQPGL